MKLTTFSLFILVDVHIMKDEFDMSDNCLKLSLFWCKISFCFNLTCLNSFINKKNYNLWQIRYIIGNRCIFINILINGNLLKSISKRLVTNLVWFKTVLSNKE